MHVTILTDTVVVSYFWFVNWLNFSDKQAHKKPGSAHWGVIINIIISLRIYFEA